MKMPTVSINLNIKNFSENEKFFYKIKRTKREPRILLTCNSKEIMINTKGLVLKILVRSDVGWKKQRYFLPRKLRQKR